MLPNNNPGFYVVCKSMDGKVRIVRFYETLEALVFAEKYHYGGTYGCKDYFSENLNDRVPYHWDKYLYVRSSGLGRYHEDENYSGYAFVVFDHNENIVPLCELNRAVNHRTYKRRQRNWRRTAWGGYRAIKTFPEKKAYYATLDQEEPVKVRGRRQPRRLPDSWDDYGRHNDKSWKTQTKRRHQWNQK